MSAKTLTKKALTALYEPLANPILLATEALVKADEALTLCRVRLGRTVADAVSALTTAGASADEAQSRIMDTIHSVYGSVEWATVQGWVRAATVADSLPAALQESFTTEALVTIGRIKPEDRDEFVTVCNAEGITGVRALREAVKAHNEAEGGTDRAKKRNVTQAADVVKVAEKYLSATPLPDRDDEGYNVALVMLGVAIGKKCPKFRTAAILSAVEETLYDGPIADDDDGSEQ